jgi:hypothetical protein
MKVGELAAEGVDLLSQGEDDCVSFAQLLLELVVLPQHALTVLPLHLNSIAPTNIPQNRGV